MKRKENKFKKVIASIALWVFGVTQILQWVTYANSFNIEWIDMSVINNSSTNNWGWNWNSWWWASWISAENISVAVTQALAKAQQNNLQTEALSKTLQTIESSLNNSIWEFYTIWDYDWDWIKDIYLFKDWWRNKVDIYQYTYSDWIYLRKKIATLTTRNTSRDRSKWTKNLLKSIKVYKEIIWKTKDWKIKSIW